MTLKKILELCKTHGFLTEISSAFSDVFKIGPSGNLLKENLKQEWFFSMVTNRDCSIFLNDGSFKSAYNFSKEISTGQLPFGVAEIVEEQLNMYKDQVNNKSDDFRSLIPYNREMLICTMFVSPLESIQYFHRWQRERKMWWRKVWLIKIHTRR